MSNLENSSQITSELQANSAQIAEIPTKPLKGKYDGRGKWKRNNFQYRERAKPGPKSLRTRHLSETKARQVLEKYDLIAELSQIYAQAFERGDLRLCVEMRENALNRAVGRPFTAVNPAESSKKNAGLLQDNRLQVAIQQLVVSPNDAKPKKTRVKMLPATAGEQR